MGALKLFYVSKYTYIFNNTEPKSSLESNK